MTSDVNGRTVDDLSRKVGCRIRELRLEQDISIRSLAEKSGLNVNTISRIENGKISPNLNSIQRISDALNLPVNSFFHFIPPTRSVVFQKSRDRQELESEFGTFVDLVPGFVNTELDLVLERVKAHVNSGKESIIDNGIEFVFCLEGCVYYEIEGQAYLLEEGDSLIYDQKLPHRWSNPGDTQSRLLTMYFPAEEKPRVSEGSSNPRR